MLLGNSDLRDIVKAVFEKLPVSYFKSASAVSDYVSGEDEIRLYISEYAGMLRIMSDEAWEKYRSLGIPYCMIAGMPVMKLSDFHTWFDDMHRANMIMSGFKKRQTRYTINTYNRRGGGEVDIVNEEN